MGLDDYTGKRLLSTPSNARNGVFDMYCLVKTFSSASGTLEPSSINNAWTLDCATRAWSSDADTLRSQSRSDVIETTSLAIALGYEPSRPSKTSASKILLIPRPSMKYVRKTIEGKAIRLPGSSSVVCTKIAFSLITRGMR